LPLQQKVAVPFPPLPTGTLPLTLENLPAYIREFNSTRAKKVLLHVYLAPGHESRSITVPVILRFLIPNVLRAFITLGHEEGIDGAVPEMPALVVESFTVFGSREKASSFPLQGFCPYLFTRAPLAETSAFAVRVHRLPEAVSMGCARLTVVAARARAELHGKHHSHDTILIDRSALTFWM
jgi:hypothetical protein